MKNKFIAPIVFLCALATLQFPTILQNASLSLKDSEASWALAQIERFSHSPLNLAMAQNYEKFENIKFKLQETAAHSVKNNKAAVPLASSVETHIQLNLPVPPTNSQSSNFTENSTQIASLEAPTENTYTDSSDKKESIRKIILIGDSMMGDVAYALRRLNSKSSDPIEVENYHKVSTGLSNQTYYDWPKELTKILSKTSLPEKTALVIFMGTNDAQNIVENNQILNFGTDAWHTAYDNRAHKLLDIAKAKNMSVYWIQIPSPGPSRASFAKRLAYVENAQKGATQSYENFYYVDTRSQLQNLKDTRQSDDIHLNSNGANVVAENLYAQIRQGKKSVK